MSHSYCTNKHNYSLFLFFLFTDLFCEVIQLLLQQGPIIEIQLKEENTQKDVKDLKTVTCIKYQSFRLNIILSPFVVVQEERTDVELLKESYQERSIESVSFSRDKYTMSISQMSCDSPLVQKSTVSDLRKVK